MKAAIITLFSTLALISASCPNDCAGHGKCNMYSGCDCYRNWMGADCSQRVCYFGLAFVDTPEGDLNADGMVSTDNVSSRTHSRDVNESMDAYYGWGGYHYSVAVNHLTNASVTTVTGNSRGEGHSYKECSNKGVCDRSSGVCTCYPGYEGEGCSLTVCPDGCSGHGVCKRIIDTNPDYVGWDAHATQSCTCDAGWSGANCAHRMCPRGDDPVTKFAGYTKITLKDRASYENDFFDSTQCGSSAAVQNVEDPRVAQASGLANYRHTVGFVNRVWSHNMATSITDGSNDFVNTSWNAYYCFAEHSVGHIYSTAEDASTKYFEAKASISSDQRIGYGATTLDHCAYTGTQTVDWENVSLLSSSLCEQQPVQWRSTGARDASAISTHDINVTGSMTSATGKMTSGGCSSGTSCADLDFWSIYLTDVDGTFSIGDQLQVEGYVTSGGVTRRNFGFSLCNYIKEISVYYANMANAEQVNEEQLLVIEFVGLNNASWTDPSQATDVATGTFSLTFTDDFGDEWTTSAMSFSAVDGNGTSNAFGSDDAAGTDLFGPSLATTIENALESLPNSVIGDVQVEYIPNASDVNPAGNVVTSQTVTSSAPVGARSTDKRYFNIKFLSNTGNIPNLKVNYSVTNASYLSSVSYATPVATLEVTTTAAWFPITLNGKISTNMECGGSAIGCTTFFSPASAHQTTKVDERLFATSAEATSIYIYNHSVSQLTLGSTGYGVDGTSENVECSNRGICDTSSGLCRCFSGFSSSDCSLQNALAQG